MRNAPSGGCLRSVRRAATWLATASAARAAAPARMAFPPEWERVLEVGKRGMDILRVRGAPKPYLLPCPCQEPGQEMRRVARHVAVQYKWGRTKEIIPSP